MTRRQATASLGATACLALLLCGATHPLIPLACLGGILFAVSVLAPRGTTLPASLLTALHTALILPLVYLALLHDPPMDFLRLLLTFAAPLLLLRSLQGSSDFNDFLIFLVSLLLVVGAVAVAPGLLPALITAVYVLVACQALTVLARRPASGRVRIRLLRPPGRWRAAPALAAHHLGLFGLLLGALVYLVAPRPGDATAPQPEEQSLADRAPGADGGRTTTAAPRTEFPRDVRIGDIGRVKRQQHVVLRLELRAEGRFYDPAPGERGMLLLRARSWIAYDPALRGWKRARSSPRPVGRSGILESGDTDLHWSFEVRGYDGMTLFMPQRSRRLRSPEGVPFFIDRTDVVTVDRPLSRYDVESAWPPRTAAEMALLLPDGRDARLFEVPEPLATDLRRYLPPGPRGDLAAAVDSLRAHFADGYRYTLDLPPALPRDVDPVLAFCERKEGHCELYASLACLFLRLKGIPARLAGGLRCAERLDTGRYQARMSNAHAWVEVPCVGMGFLALDFTPGDTSAVSPASGPGEEAGGEDAAARAEAEGGGGLDWRHPFDYGPEEQEQVLQWMGDRVGSSVFLTATGGFFLLLLLWAGFVTLKQARGGPLRVRAPAGMRLKTLAFYVRWLKACAAAGHLRRRSQTPREFLATLPPELRGEGDAVTAEFERLRYGAR